ncbi:SURF1 family protein [uncultured Phenylobacterium sp.]|uniref:SURF1 family protein n=1 Tax=uncultured Phenylobacterium sp. TaxID=349273 RepID=UPI0025F47F05|nr:SURF1 family protein [uncultured Phenylobacterium sp.]
MATDKRVFPVGLTIAVAIAFAILVALGTWQVQRLHWKEGVLARVAALQVAPARPIETVLQRSAAGDLTRVKAICPGLAKAPFLEVYAIRDGQAGSRLISACRLPDGTSILVDRGFVPDIISARAPVDAADVTPIEVTGVLRAPDRPNLFSPANTPARWYVRDVAAMAAALKAPNPAPLFLFAETPTNPEWKALTPGAIPADIPNNHFAYALTWYGLAAALLGVYAAMLFRKRNS